MTKTQRQQTMNKNGVKLDNALNPLSVNNGTECWSQWNVIGYRPPTERDDGTIVKRKCECGQSLYHSFLMENRHTKQQVDSIGLNCIKNHFPLDSYKVALGLKKQKKDEDEYCDEALYVSWSTRASTGVCAGRVAGTAMIRTIGTARLIIKKRCNRPILSVHT